MKSCFEWLQLEILQFDIFCIKTISGARKSQVKCYSGCLQMFRAKRASKRGFFYALPVRGIQGTRVFPVDCYPGISSITIGRKAFDISFENS